MNEFYRQLRQMKADCEAILKTHQEAIKAVDALRATPVPTPSPTSAPTPLPTSAPTSHQKHWRFIDQTGKIPDSLILRAASDPHLLEAIASEIQERAAHERQG